MADDRAVTRTAGFPDTGMNEDPTNMHRDRGDEGQFARTASEAWRPSWKFRMRNLARRQALRWADQWHRPEEQKFVRCLYSHAVFPEHRDRLRTIVRSLKQKGEFIDTKTLIDIINSKSAPDGRYFHLSFDDGFANVFEQGRDIFAEEKVPYTIFIATDLIDADLETMVAYNDNALKYGKPVRPMTWEQVRECVAAGGEIGCHTRSHARLSAISNEPDRLAAEIGDARAIIERETGRPCISFAWPYGQAGDIDAKAIEAIREYGFSICFSAQRGRVVTGQTDLWRVPRHQMELHWPVWENLLWARGYREMRRS
jgi:peptidoglycan/xylan/chitin deacetylase (PgdA/CDA1 family)